MVPPNLILCQKIIIKIRKLVDYFVLILNQYLREDPVRVKKLYFIKRILTILIVDGILQLKKLSNLLYKLFLFVFVLNKLNPRSGI